MTPAQSHFLALHASHTVTKWRWYWFETMLRATVGKRTATLSVGEADDLVDAGLMEWGLGCADMRVTEAGREEVRAQRAARLQALQVSVDNS